MNLQTLKNHLVQLKFLNQLPNHFLLRSQTLTFQDVSAILKILNCPYQTNCPEDCMFCQEFDKDNLNVVHLISPSDQFHAITGAQIDALRYWVSLHTSLKRLRFFWIQEAHLLTPAAHNRLLKLLEESPPGMLGVFTTRQWNVLPRTLLSRLHFFSVEKHSYPTKFSNQILTLSEQKILDKLAETNFVQLNAQLLNDYFVALKLQTDLFLRHLHQNEVKHFINNSDEAIIHEHFWLFLQILLLQINFILWEDEVFVSESALLKQHTSQLPVFIREIVRLLYENHRLFQNTKNQLSTKLTFLHFLYEAESIFNVSSDLR